ncbi:PREDICTED: F-box protein PP2-B10-like [Nicotiana attenuata]|uniref:F-box protein pp2-b10 n=1 Tax=Nicotiana attenuata TaxID=49451 RepID=A0A1J6IYP6_NICAT|nr:PREDICTED: F-box protein PP2-B10-like [Nicotiana attenuata]OIT05664.1 f-box protein pp2-b10 [Nicotiana attenuata]
MNYFERLPEGCILEILSHTTPVDAVRSCILSRGFKSALESEIIWERFLPSDYQEIIERSEFSPSVCTTKKELYFRLCESPILLDGGKLSFSLDKHSGKKCFMVAPRELIISWGDNLNHWQWKPHPDSRFSEVASLSSVRRLDIRGKIGTKMLSPKTDYSAYLVYKLVDNPYGLESANAIVRFVDYESDTDTENQANTVKLETLPESRRNGGYLQFKNGKFASMRADGWMEVKMGDFNSKKGGDGPVEARLIEIKRLHLKGGLIVEGIEFRPK